MKAIVVYLFVFCYINIQYECRKIYPPIDKNANLAFINMEGGAGVRPGSKPAAPVAQAPQAATAAPAKPPSTAHQPAVVPPTTKPAATQPVQPPSPVKPVATPVAKPAQTPNQIKPVPVNPAPVANPITTPGPGSVKQLINFYDSQGKASPIRPYSYSQAVKQG